MSSESQKNNTNESGGRKTSLLGSWSLTTKITSWYTLFLILMLAVLSIFVYQFTSQWESNELHTNLESTSLTMADDMSQFKTYQKGIFYIAYSQEGLIIKGALPDGFPKQTVLSPHKVSAITVNDMTYYYYDTPVHSSDFSGWLRSITPSRNMSTRASNMIFALLMGAFTTLILGIIGGYLLIKRALKPLRTITKTAAAIGQEKDLSQRLPDIDSGKDELYDLTQTLNRMLTSLENASIRERQFSSDVSHELRTPIAVIQAESDFGRKHIKNLEDARESFNNIFKQSRFMSELVSQLLELARMDQASELPKEPVDLSNMLNELCHDYELICANNNIQFSFYVAPDLLLEGHRTSLHRAVANFLDNAIKFTKSRITLNAHINEDNTIMISVIDDGIGIQEENLSKIWARLYQTEFSRSHNKNKGVGLGLYFVKRVADLHHGTVKATSQPNVRTEFIISLPRYTTVTTK